MISHIFFAAFTSLIFIILVSLIKVLFSYSFGKLFFGLRSTLKNAGEWAIVTGSTSGIGRAISEELASDGLNIVLISQSEDKLVSFSRELEDKFKIKTKYIILDFTKPSIYNEIKNKIDSLSVAILVNNVGTSYDHPDCFATSDQTNLARNEALINCNALSMAQMSRIVLQKMYSDPIPTRGTRIILNIGSYSGLIPSPFLTTYAATKAFVLGFTRSLAVEAIDKKIFVQAVMPFFVATAMSKITKTSLLIPSANTYARSTLNMLGVETVGNGYFYHSLLCCMTNLIPEFIFGKIVKNNLLTVRSKSLKRAKGK